MLGFGLVWLVTVPFDVLSLWWQRRYDQSHESYGEALFGDWFLLVVEFAAPVVRGARRGRAREVAAPATGGSRPRRSSSACRCCCSSSRRTWCPTRTGSDNPRLEAAAARIAERGGRQRRADPRGEGAHEGSERLHDRPRAVAEGVRLELDARRALHRAAARGRRRPRVRPSGEEPPAQGHRLVRALHRAARLPDRGRGEAARRDAGGGGDPARAARLRRVRPRGDTRCRRRSRGTWRRRPTGWRCRRPATRARPRRSGSGLRRPASATRTRPRRRTSSSTTTRR